MDKHPRYPCRSPIHISELQVAYGAIASHRSHRPLVYICKGSGDAFVKHIGKVAGLLDCHLCHLRIALWMAVIAEKGYVAQCIEIVVAFDFALAVDDISVAAIV